MVSSIYRWRHTRTDLSQPSPKALADRARRQQLPETRDNTGVLLGDPPAGRSALDRKLEATKREVLWLEQIEAQANEEDGDE